LVLLRNFLQKTSRFGAQTRSGGIKQNAFRLEKNAQRILSRFDPKKQALFD